MAYECFNMQFHDPKHWQQDLTNITICVISWTLLYLLLKKTVTLAPLLGMKQYSVTQEIELKNRFVSIVHGLVAIYFTTYFFYTDKLVCGELNNEYQRKVIIFSLSYFIYDTFCLIAEGLLDGIIAFHHLITGLALLIPLIEGRAGNFLLIAIYCGEFATPALHITDILRMTGRRYTLAYEASEAMLIFGFFYSRFFCHLTSTVIFYNCNQINMIIKVCCTFFFAMNIVYFYLEFPMLKRKF